MEAAEELKGKYIEDRYLVTYDGTVTYQQTGLMWIKSVFKDTFTFNGACQVAKNLSAKNAFLATPIGVCPVKKSCSVW